MKFSEFTYERPNLEDFKNEFEVLLKQFNDSKSLEEQNQLMADINSLRSKFDTMEQIAYIRHTINTEDSTYEEEQNFFDQNKPVYDEMISKYYKALTNSKYKKELKEKWGEQVFNIANLTMKTFSTEIIEDLKEENKLMSEYTKLLSSAQIDFEGEKRSLPQLRPFQMSTNRAIRKNSNEAKYNFFKENEKKFDDIYDKLVKVRDQMAKKLGYENFIELGYDRMVRSDYNPDMVKNFREQVRKDIVPIATKLREIQKNRLELNKLMYYDEVLTFKDGNANLIGDADYILKKGKEMYESLSKETNIFFDEMVYLLYFMRHMIHMCT